MGRPRKTLRPHPSRLIAAAALTATAALVATAVPASAAGGTTSAATATTNSREASVPAFYTPPQQLPAANGELIRTERLPLALALPGIGGPLPGRATRLMYKSTDSNGRPVAVTGAYIEPTAAWKAGGPRPLVAVAPGTMGQGDQCSTSLALQRPLALNGDSISFGYEVLSVYRLLARGIAVVVTDYAGLGATDRLHTYVNRVDEGHAVLDAVRAARRVDGTSVTTTSPVGLYGYSQGGGATASAAELQPSYAPDVTLSGTYAGAPPANLTEVTKSIDGSALAGALGWSLNGFLQSEPSLKPITDAAINTAGRSALADVATMCIGDAIFRYGFTKSSKWTNDGRSVSALIAAEPRLQAFLDAQRIGKLKPAGPVRVATGVQDDIVGHAQARQLAVDWCDKGADVTYVPVRLPNLGDKLLTNHVAPLITDQGNAISWLSDRLSGRPTTTNCATLPTQR